MFGGAVIFFLKCILSVVLPSVVLPCCMVNTTDRMVAPLTFDRSFGVFHTGEMRNVNRKVYWNAYMEKRMLGLGKMLKSSESLKIDLPR